MIAAEELRIAKLKIWSMVCEARIRNAELEALIEKRLDIKIRSGYDNR